MLSRDSQYSNACAPMLVTPSGIVKLDSNVQDENAYLPMVVNELGIITLVSALQYLKASYPMLVTPSGISTLTSKPLPANNLSRILITPNGIDTSVSPCRFIPIKTPSSTIHSTPSTSRTSIPRFKIKPFHTSPSSPSQPDEADDTQATQSEVLANVSSPTVGASPSKTTHPSLLHDLNAIDLICVTLLGILTLVRLVAKNAPPPIVVTPSGITTSKRPE